MTREAEQRIADILEAIERCRGYAASLDSDDANLVNMAEDAIERNLQIIGEAVTHLPAGIIDSHPEIPWSRIRGFRIVLVHKYFGVDAAIIREVIEEHLPPLSAALQQHVSS